MESEEADAGAGVVKVVDIVTDTRRSRTHQEN